MNLAAYQAAISVPAKELINMGSLQVPTGQLVACDPFMCAGSAPFTRRVPPGTYAVRLRRTDLQEAGWRIALAMLIIDPDEPAVSIEEAELEQGGADGYFVDSGLGALMDEAARAQLSAVLAAFFRAEPKGNYYDDVLAAEFKHSADDPGDPDDIGQWNMHSLPGTRLNVAMFASGMGDGAYRSYWALGKDGKPVALVTDFGIL